MVNVSLRDRKGAPLQSQSGAVALPAPRSEPGRAVRGRRPPLSHRRLIYLCGFAAAIVAAALVGHLVVTGVRSGLLPADADPDPRPITVGIAGRTLAIPGDMIRFAAARKGGAMERIDLAMVWPALTGFAASVPARPGDHAAAAKLVFVTIRPADDSGDTTSRLDSLYTPFFSDEAWAGPGDLVGVRLDERSGYAGEDLFFQPEVDKPFVARCLTDRGDGVPPSCMREIVAEPGLSVLYRFDKSLLAEWPSLDPAITARVKEFLGK